MNRIKNKLRSQRGASITFALLLSLVCMVVGSVVLAAGMAAAGRMSKVAEMDQRYYSVTSAADLLAKELTGEDKKITITRTKKETVTTETVTELEIDVNGNVNPDITSTTNKKLSYTTVINDTSNRYTVDAVTNLTEAQNTANTGEEIGYTGNRVFLTECAIDLMYGDDSATLSWNKANWKDAMGYTFGMTANKAGAFTLEHSGLSSSLGVEAADLKIYCLYTLKTDGTLVIKLSSGDTNAPNAKDIYTLVLTLSPEIEETSNTSTSAPAVSTSTDGNTTTTTTTTEEINTITSTIKWAVKSVTKEGA